VAGDSAIILEPLGELRLAAGSYLEKARELGLVFQAKTSLKENTMLDLQSGKGSVEGTTGESTGGKHRLPPGFDVD
jgi:hypothetical protein